MATLISDQLGDGPLVLVRQRAITYIPRDAAARATSTTCGGHEEPFTLEPVRPFPDTRWTCLRG